VFVTKPSHLHTLSWAAHNMQLALCVHGAYLMPVTCMGLSSQSHSQPSTSSKLLLKPLQSATWMVTAGRLLHRDVQHHAASICTDVLPACLRPLCCRSHRDLQ
jgi:hypothetical protein